MKQWRRKLAGGREEVEGVRGGNVGVRVREEEGGGKGRCEGSGGGMRGTMLADAMFQ